MKLYELLTNGYKRKDWRKEVYVYVNEEGDLSLFNGTTSIKYTPSLEDMISNDWEPKT